MLASQTIGGLALVLSNLALVPAILHSIWMFYMTEAFVLSVLMFVSSFYHCCQTDFFCLTSLTSLRVCDHFFVYTTLIWVTMFFLEMHLTVRLIVLILIQPFLLPVLIDDIGSWWIAIGLVITLTIFSIIYMVVVLERFPKFDILDLISAAILIGVGLFFHIWSGDPGSSRYTWAHSIWHLFVMLGIFFVLELKDGKDYYIKLFESCIYYSSTNSRSESAIAMENREKEFNKT